MATVVTTTEALAALPLHAVLVDRLGLAYQVVQQGSDTSFAKSGADTRRNGFAQVGGFTIYTAEQMASALPVRVVDSGEPETGAVAYKVIPSTTARPSAIATARRYSALEDAVAAMGEGLVIEAASERVVAFHERHLRWLEAGVGSVTVDGKA